MKSKLGDKQRLQHILIAIQEIESYTANITFDDFFKNSMMRFASIKQIEIIGEAANYIDRKTRSQFPTIAWQQITGIRNILVHEYFGVDVHLIWAVIINDLPLLKIQIQNVIDSLA